jgi:hypothetical protein
MQLLGGVDLLVDVLLGLKIDRLKGRLQDLHQSTFRTRTGIKVLTIANACVVGAIFSSFDSVP